jgi:hypothetical protein
VENHDHHHFNSGAFGLGLYLIARNRRLERERAAQEPYRRAERAAWWAGLTQAQQEAYERELRRQTAIDATPAQESRPKIWKMVLGLLVVVYLAGVLVHAVADSISSARKSDQRAWCVETVDGFVNGTQADLDWCVANYDEARRIYDQVHQGR